MCLAPNDFDGAARYLYYHYEDSNNNQVIMISVVRCDKDIAPTGLGRIAFYPFNSLIFIQGECVSPEQFSNPLTPLSRGNA